MKLLQCKKCADCFVLRGTPRKCECGQCGGKYLNPPAPEAVYFGEAIVIVIDNNTLKQRYNEMSKGVKADKIMDNLIGPGQIGCFIMQPELPNWHTIRKLSPMETL